jgi:phage baseplate assembly protein W
MVEVIKTISSLQKKYSDLDFNFNSNPGNGDVSRKINVESVKQSVKNLLLTKQGERFFQPDLYSDLYSLLFENFSLTTKFGLESVIRQLLEKYEPRIIINSIDVTERIENNALEVTLRFEVIALRVEATYVVLIDRLR